MRVDKSVIVLFRQMNLFLNRELLDEKLTSSDVLYLALLYEQDGRTQDEMAEAYTVDRAATTRSLQGLEKKGLVRREVDTFDRRIRRVYLTEKAMQYRTAIRRMADDLADALFEGMSEEEVKAFMEQVEAMGPPISAQTIMTRPGLVFSTRKKSISSPLIATEIKHQIPLILSLIADPREPKIKVTAKTDKPEVFAPYQSAPQTPLAWPRVRKAVYRP